MLFELQVSVSAGHLGSKVLVTLPIRLVNFLSIDPPYHLFTGFTTKKGSPQANTRTSSLKSTTGQSSQGNKNVADRRPVSILRHQSAESFGRISADTQRRDDGARPARGPLRVSFKEEEQRKLDSDSDENEAGPIAGLPTRAFQHHNDYAQSVEKSQTAHRRAPSEPLPAVPDTLGFPSHLRRDRTSSFDTSTGPFNSSIQARLAARSNMAVREPSMQRNVRHTNPEFLYPIINPDFQYPTAAIQKDGFKRGGTLLQEGLESRGKDGSQWDALSSRLISSLPGVDRTPRSDASARAARVNATYPLEDPAADSEASCTDRESNTDESTSMSTLTVRTYGPLTS